VREGHWIFTPAGGLFFDHKPTWAERIQIWRWVRRNFGARYVLLGLLRREL